MEVPVSPDLQAQLDKPATETGRPTGVSRITLDGDEIAWHPAPLPHTLPAEG